MASFTDEADYDAGETFGNDPSQWANAREFTASNAVTVSRNI
ncbi:unnamed protein product [Protopolystoma xenopodis]|uniref:Uncharacterized protein n=1 Tax=Protopolystoma xenopodis TaxID=117903 RepID=A0A448XNA5_9PLAT|nr:unnamed protein product [Protopolystoma xenopodis]